MKLSKTWPVLFFFFLFIFCVQAFAQTELPAVRIEMPGCVKYTYDNSRRVFENKKAVEQELSNNEINAADCRKIINRIDFEKFTLLGIVFQNAECHGFALEYKVIKDEAARAYRFQIAHPPLTFICEGLSRHELWVLAPKLPAGYRVDFDVETKMPFGTEVRLPEGGFFDEERGCLQINTMVYNEESLKALLAFDQCAKTLKADQFDLKKQTIIGYSVGGDCHMRLENKLYRDDAKKMFTLVSKNIWGGCRAGGWRHGLVTIDKISADYRVKFVEYLVEDDDWRDIREHSDSGAVWTPDGIAVSKPYAFYTREVDLKGCIQLIMKKELVIRTNEEFLKAIRTDAGRDRCLKDIEKIDFTQYSLMGTNLNTGYCDHPTGLQPKAFSDSVKKQVILQISYIDPKGSVCRAVSSYDLWVQVPKIPDGYEVKFEEKTLER
jgi:hypothetical protein